MPPELQRLLRQAADDTSVISFAGGLPSPRTFPRARLAELADEVLRRGDDQALQYGWPEGHPELRAIVARRLARRGLAVSADDVLITNGAQDAIGFVVDVLEARSVQVDALTYPSALELFHSRGCTPVTTPAPLRYAMPAMHNPLGRALDANERAVCLRNEWLIEDDAYADLVFDGAPAPSLAVEAPERVFHIGTLSKIVAPGLRVGWLVAPPSFRERLRRLKSDQDLHSSGLTQSLATKLLRDEAWFDERLAQLRSFYATRAARLVHGLAAMPELTFTAPTGGFSVWVETPFAIDDELALRTAANEFKVAWDAGRLFRAAPRRRDTLAFRLSFSALPDARFDEGTSRLKRALDTLAAGSLGDWRAVP